MTLVGDPPEHRTRDLPSQVRKDFTREPDILLPILPTLYLPLRLNISTPKDPK